MADRGEGDCGYESAVRQIMRRDKLIVSTVYLHLEVGLLICLVYYVYTQNRRALSDRGWMNAGLGLDYQPVTAEVCELDLRGWAVLMSSTFDEV